MITAPLTAVMSCAYKWWIGMATRWCHAKAPRSILSLDQQADTALDYAARGGVVAILQWLVKERSKLQLTSRDTDGNGTTVMM